MPRSSPQLPGEPTKPSHKHLWDLPEGTCLKSYPVPLFAGSWSGIRRTIDDDPARAAAVAAILARRGMPGTSPKARRRVLEAPSAFFTMHSDYPETMTAPEALRRLAKRRLDREHRGRAYAGPSLEWTGPHSQSNNAVGSGASC